MQIFASHIHMEMQQRGSEYSQLFLKYEGLRPALLERMPPLETSHNHQSGISEMTNGEQTPSPLSSDELPISETESVQDSVSFCFDFKMKHFYYLLSKLTYELTSSSVCRIHYWCYWVAIIMIMTS